MWPGLPWTDREVHELGRWQKTEKAFHHLWSAGLGLLKPQPVPRAGGKEGSWTSPKSQEMDPPGCSLLPVSPL